MRRKLNLGFLSIILLLWVICIVSIINNINVQKFFINLKNDIIPGVISTTMAKYYAIEIRAWTLTYILRGNVIRNNKKTKKWLHISWDNLKKTTKNHFEHECHIGIGEKKTAEKIINLSKALISASAEIVKLKDQGTGINELFEKIKNEFRQSFYPLRNLLEKHLLIHLDELSIAKSIVYSKINATIRNTTMLCIIATLLSLFIGLSVDKLFVNYITKHKQDEEKLKRSLSLHKATLQSTADGILVVNKKGKIMSYNKILLEMCSVPDSVIKSHDNNQFMEYILNQLKDPQIFFKKMMHLQTISDTKDSNIIEFKDGKTFEIYSQPYWIKKERVGRVWSFRDITEPKKLLEQLIHSEKLSAVGELASGIAHEFNNILTIILATTQMSMMEMENTEELLNSLKVIEDQSKRGARIVKDINIITRPTPPHLEINNISEIIDQTISIIKKRFQLENIKIKTKYHKYLNVLIDPGQIHQVFLNLIINSHDAILPKGKGTILISTNDINDKVEIRITDNGIGMDEKTKLKTFTPFFTTKGAKAKDSLKIKGTGLGLSVSHSIIQKHNGTIAVESEKGKGTTFIITLPKAEPMHTEKQYIKKKLNQKEVKKIKKLKILVVDDEKGIINIMVRILKKFGQNKIITAESGAKALSLFKEAPSDFDLVFLDMIIPDMNGEKIFKKIKKIVPDIPVVFMSGQLEVKKDKLIKKGAYAFLQKPIDMSELSNIINKISDKKKEA